MNSPLLKLIFDFPIRRVAAVECWRVENIRCESAVARRESLIINKVIPSLQGRASICRKEPLVVKQGRCYAAFFWLAHRAL
jgi:hypothetical protein